MARLLLLLSLLIIGFSAAGQGLPGYVLTLTGDTLRGVVQEKGGNRIQLYTSPSSPPHSFRASQIRGYGIGRNPLISSRVVRLCTGADSVRFVLPELQGPVSLYIYAKESSRTLLSPASSDTLYELDAVNWHLVLNRFLRACPTMSQTDPAVLELPYAPEYLNKLIGQYNRCLDPNWRPAHQSRLAPWRQGFAARLTVMHITDAGTFLPMKSAGLEWTGLRSNGLQAGLQLNYVLLTGRSAPSPLPVVDNRPLEERRLSSYGLIAPSMNVSKRYGRPQKPNIFAGAGIGFALLAHARVEAQRRPVGSGAAFQTASVSRSGEAGGVAYFSANTGFILPLNTRNELSISAHLQSWGPLRSSLWGAQLAYYWFRK